jgi:hypothetical protein
VSDSTDELCHRPSFQALGARLRTLFDTREAHQFPPEVALRQKAVRPIPYFVCFDPRSLVPAQAVRALKQWLRRWTIWHLPNKSDSIFHVPQAVVQEFWPELSKPLAVVAVPLRYPDRAGPNTTAHCWQVALPYSYLLGISFAVLGRCSDTSEPNSFVRQHSRMRVSKRYV